MQTKAIAISFCLFTSPLIAEANRYSFLEGGYLNYEDDAGLRLAASLLLTPQIAVFGEFSDTGPVDQISAGLMWRQALNAKTDWILGASLESIEFARRDDTGLGLRAGLRMATPEPALEIHPEIRHRVLFDDGLTSFRLGGTFRLTHPFSLQVALQAGDEDVFEAGVRYAF